MSIIRLLVLCLFYSGFLCAQTFENRFFGETIGADFNAVQVLPVSNHRILVLSNTNTPDSGGYHVALLMFTDDGQLLWKQVYTPGYGTLVSAAHDGGYIVCGKSLRSEFGNEQGFLLKTDSDGNQEWNRSLSMGNQLIANHVIPSKSGGYILCGTIIVANDPNGRDAFWARFDEDGAMSRFEQLHSPSTNFAFHLLELSNGNFLLNHIDNGEYLRCISPNGSIVWEKNLYTDLQYDTPADLQFRMIEDRHGHIWLDGGYDDANPPTPQVLELSASGNELQRINLQSDGINKALYADPAGDVYELTYGISSLTRTRLGNTGIISIIAYDSLPYPPNRMYIRNENEIFLSRYSIDIDVEPIVLDGKNVTIGPRWIYSSGRPFSHEVFHTEIRDLEGNFWVLGSGGAGISSYLGLEFFVLKLDPTGQLITKTALQETTRINNEGEMALLSDGSVLIRSYETIWKVNPDGKVAWTRGTVPTSKLLADSKGGFLSFQTSIDSGLYFRRYDPEGIQTNEEVVLYTGADFSMLGGIANLEGGFTLWAVQYNEADTLYRQRILYLDENGRLMKKFVLPKDYPYWGGQHHFFPASDGGMLAAFYFFNSKVQLLKVENGQIAWNYDFYGSDPGSMRFLSLEELPCKGYVLAVEINGNVVNAPGLFPASTKKILLHHIDELGQGRDFYTYYPLPEPGGPVDTSFLPGYIFRTWGTLLNHQTQDIFLQTVQFPEEKIRDTPPGQLNILPNPSGEEICLQYASETLGNIRIEIFNEAGRRVDFRLGRKPDPEFDFHYSSNLPKGIYFIKLTDGSGKSLVQKWCKMR